MTTTVNRAEPSNELANMRDGGEAYTYYNFVTFLVVWLLGMMLKKTDKGARMLFHKVMRFVLSVLGMLLVVTVAHKAAAQDSVNEVVLSVNSERGAHAVREVVLDSRLTQIAQRYANDMLKRGYFSHTSPEGLSMRGRLVAGGVRPGWAGENIARGQRDADSVMESWMNSAGHRRNILNGKFQKVGVARAGDIWVQVFTN